MRNDILEVPRGDQMGRLTPTPSVEGVDPSGWAL